MENLKASCIFCQIIKREAPTTIDFENEVMIAFRSKFPVAETHVLLVPKIHVDTFLDLDDQTIADLKNAAKQVIEKLGIRGAYKLVINGGKYQAIPHFHWHLLAGKLEDKEDVLNKT